jgi:exopolysaccharide biosynthesis polyprenyl glycosylphosphotransferase
LFAYSIALATESDFGRFASSLLKYLQSLHSGAGDNLVAIDNGPKSFRHSKSWRRFLPALERLRSSQLRDGSVYSDLRAFVPVLVLGIILTQNNVSIASQGGLHGFIAASVTIRHLILAVGVVTLWNLWLSLSVYRNESALRDFFAEMTRLAWAAICCGLVFTVGHLTGGRPDHGITTPLLLGFCLIIVAFVLLGAFLLFAVLSPRLLRRRFAIIVGSGKRADILRARLASRSSPFKLYGCVDDEYQGTDPAKDLYLGPVSTLAELLKDRPIEAVLIGLPIRSMYDTIQNVIDTCETVGVESHYMYDLFETSRDRVQVQAHSPHAVTVLTSFKPDPKQYIKRLIDLFGGVFLVLLFSPVMIVAAVAVRFTSPGSVFFVQQRYGRHRQRFPMFKFRSMVVDAEKKQAALESQNEAQGPVFKITTDPRVTRVGKFLRRTSIDELPQLFNVIRGDMSLVGPRPLPLRDVSRFEEMWLLRRFSVRPGLTCLWQVNGRSNTSFEFWIKQDLTYIDEWSLWLDFKILLKTIPAVIRGSGAV